MKRDVDKARDWQRAGAEAYSARRLARLQRRAAVGERLGLAQVSPRRAERAAAEGRRPEPPLKQGNGFAASAAQRRKVEAEGGCRVLARHEHGDELPAAVLAVLERWPAAGGPVDPAHVIARSRGGCDAAVCVVPLARPLHAAFDDDAFDLLDYLTPEEIAHAVFHVGIVRALRFITGSDWAPVTPPVVDRLPELTYDEQAEVVEGVGIDGALLELTGREWRAGVARCAA